MEEPLVREDKLWRTVRMAIFDGMGGEAFGEEASRTAAERMCALPQKLGDILRPEEEILQELCENLNDAVVTRAMELEVPRIGSTMAMIVLHWNAVYVCNLGDSPVFRLRDGALEKLSQDHVRKQEGNRKAPITRFLGLDPEEYLVEPTITKFDLLPGDQFLLCSDGMTDMVEEGEIVSLMERAESAAEGVSLLRDTAMDHGGKDNITVMICRALPGPSLPKLGIKRSADEE